jgi:hypothetical protein
MVEVSLSREASKEPEWLKSHVIAEVRSILEASFKGTVNAARVESIVYDADRSHASMDVRLTPALNNVNLSFGVER